MRPLVGMPLAALHIRLPPHRPTDPTAGVSVRPHPAQDPAPGRVQRRQLGHAPPSPTPVMISARGWGCALSRLHARGSVGVVAAAVVWAGSVWPRRPALFPPAAPWGCSAHPGRCWCSPTCRPSPGSPGSGLPPQTPCAAASPTAGSTWTGRAAAGCWAARTPATGFARRRWRPRTPPPRGMTSPGPRKRR
jgi:hypothetical protein